MNARPRENGVLLMTILGVFLAGIALGGFFIAYTSQAPLQVVAANDAAAQSTLAVPHAAPQIKLRQ